MKFLVHVNNPTEAEMATRMLPALHEFLASLMKFDQDSLVTDHPPDEVTLEIEVVSLASQAVLSDFAKLSAMQSIPNPILGITPQIDTSPLSRAIEQVTKIFEGMGDLFGGVGVDLQKALDAAAPLQQVTGHEPTAPNCDQRFRDPSRINQLAVCEICRDVPNVLSDAYRHAPHISFGDPLRAPVSIVKGDNGSAEPSDMPRSIARDYALPVIKEPNGKIIFTVEGTA